jgi:hypothetical protein
VFFPGIFGNYGGGRSLYPVYLSLGTKQKWSHADLFAAFSKLFRRSPDRMITVPVQRNRHDTEKSCFHKDVSNRLARGDKHGHRRQSDAESGPPARNLLTPPRPGRRSTKIHRTVRSSPRSLKSSEGDCWFSTMRLAGMMACSSLRCPMRPL